MKRDEMDNLVNGIREKLGDELSAKISDDLGTLLTDNNNVLQQIENQENIINTLKQDKESLITANGNLLKQIPMGQEIDIVDKEEIKEHFNFENAFDEKGNFK